MTEERTSSLEGLTKEEILTKENEAHISDQSIQHALDGAVEINNKIIPRLSSDLTAVDRTGTLKMRLGINRSDYKVPTGVYAIGTPVQGATMFVTCNYKLTVDYVRQSLAGQSCFLLVLDTKGINVWCAAGKGTFSSRELIYQLHKHQVKKVLGVRKVYLPQLGASMMEPHLVRKYTGVSVAYGPVRCEDLPEFIHNGFQATKQMRTVTFSLKERLVLAPLETILYAKYVVYTLVVCLMLSLLMTMKGQPFAIEYTVQGCFYGVMALMLGSIIFPMLLPKLPFKYFSHNGYLLSTVVLIPLMLNPIFPSMWLNIIFAGWLITMIGYITFNFTGSTTFTSQSGVEIEAKQYKRFVKGMSMIGVVLIVMEVIL